MNKFEVIEKFFPEVITEKNFNGKLKKAVDFELLKNILTDEISDERESYNFNWVGKNSARIEAYRKIDKTLRPCIDESENFFDTENLYIEGDNLDVLKLLQQSYLHKIRMIYIDPPYNTGKDFIYKDNFEMDAEKYAEAVELYDDEGNLNFAENTNTNPRFHSDWCSMIYSRLILARNLLTEDGVIFISIDDNEQANLKKICDEVFGEKNFIANVILTRSTNGMGDKKGFALNHEYVLCYQKSDSTKFNGLSPSTEYKKLFDKEDSYGKYKIDGILMKKGTGSRRQDSPTLYFPLYYSPINGNVSLKPTEGYCERYPIKSDGSEGRWTWSKEKISNENYRLYASPNGTIYIKDYLTDDRRMKIKSVLVNSDYLTDRATNEIKNIFKNKIFDTPKSIKFIHDLIDMSLKDNDIVLDFFSGSATTAHAVMQLNSEDNGKRKFIMVQLPEVCSENTEAFKAGYKNICEIGKERIRRAGRKISIGDIGFRVLKVDSSNFRKVAFKPSELTQEMLLDLAENIKSDRTGLDLLFGSLTDLGVELNLSLAEENYKGVKIYRYDENILACFDEKIELEIFEHMAVEKPRIAIFRDNCFIDDAEKINAEEIFKMISPDTKFKVL